LVAGLLVIGALAARGGLFERAGALAARLPVVLEQEHVCGTLFAVRMLPAWIASIAVVIVVLALMYRHGLHGGRLDSNPRLPVRFGPGAVGAIGAAALVLALHDPALPVLALAVVVAAWARLEPRAGVTAANPALLAGVFAVAVALGTVARGIRSGRSPSRPDPGRPPSSAPVRRSS
jgi:hypothetical protein